MFVSRTVSVIVFFSCYSSHRDLHSFPTRRSSDLIQTSSLSGVSSIDLLGGTDTVDFRGGGTVSLSSTTLDRKSTRLNSSHGYTSYAVFCLQKNSFTSITGGAGNDTLTLTTNGTLS